MRYNLLVIVETDDPPKNLVDAAVASLQSHPATTVLIAAMKTTDGRAVAMYALEKGPT